MAGGAGEIGSFSAYSVPVGDTQKREFQGIPVSGEKVPFESTMIRPVRVL